MRPTQRPIVPYTIEEVLDRVHQHFVVEGNPRCTRESDMCIYQRTGCAVGCMITAEDAKEWDNHNSVAANGTPIQVIRGGYPVSYETYFGGDERMLGLLIYLQSAHDVTNGTSIKDRIIAALDPANLHRMTGIVTKERK